MKKIFLLFIFAISCVNAQTYTFDYQLKIGKKIKMSPDKNFENYSLLINSKNPQYDIGLHNNSYGALSDDDKHIAYHFSYSPNRRTERFSFNDNLKFTPQDEFEIDHILVEKIGENKYAIKCYKKQNAKRPVLDIIASLKPNEDDLIRFYYLDLSHNIQTKIINSLKEKLNGNYILEEYTANYRNCNSHYFIEKLDKINLTLSIPNK
ncbi:hypothetical protein GCM10022217_00090 [Chryseobacterium ginsenosidimutans]|uniref:hypothetical protein n=1 Tax=Chryseobacterium ginsenosidimutans TaxID=687846 RepID=UPI0031DC0357